MPPNDSAQDRHHRRAPARLRAGLPYRPCVGIMLVSGGGDIFAGERIDTPGAWQMPQGGIDAGESAEDAALRELEEEIGVPPTVVRLEEATADWVTYDLPDDLLGKVWKGRYRGQKQRWFRARFLGLDSDIRLDTAHPEFARWQWMRPKALLKAIVPFKRAVYESVLNELCGEKIKNN